MRLNLGLFVTLLSVSLSPTLANAQISADTTLPNNTIVTPSGPAFQITGGTTVGNNLFHSFSEFSLNTGEAALFFNTPTINNIFSRITGNNASSINGVIQVQNPVNFYFLNPNGIIFGPNASLNVGGSFFASTAESVIFADGTEFSATTPSTSPLLTVSVPTALQFGGSPGNITVQGTGHNLQPGPGGAVISAPPATFLNVDSGQTLALVGGEVNIEGGNVVAREGEIEVGSVGSNQRVAITSDLNLDYTDVSSFQDINLSQKASIDVSGSGGGRIHVQGRQINVGGGSNIVSITEGGNPGVGVTVNASESLNLIGTDSTGFIPSGILTETIPRNPGGGSGGRLEMNAPNISITDGAQASSSSFSSGAAGNIVVNNQVLEIRGTSPNGFAGGIFAATRGLGEGGNITINNEQITLQDGGFIESTTLGDQPAGNIFINTQNLSVTGGSQVSTSTFGGGNAGELRIEAEMVRLSGFEGQSSGLFSQVNEQTATGQGGNVNIETQQLWLEDGAQISTSTFGGGNAGDLQIEAERVRLSGFESKSSGLFSQVDFQATGQGGRLSLETQQLQIQDGAQISASTFGEGNSGVVEIQASEEIEVSGTGIDQSGKEFTSGIFTQVNPDATGQGGDIFVNTSRLSLQSEGVVSAGTTGLGDGGNVTVDASELVEIQGENTAISARTRGSGNAGNVTVTTPSLIIGNQGSVTVEGLGTGDAGNLEVNSDRIDLNQGNITGETQSGQGGNLTLTGHDIRLLNNSLISTTAGTADQPGDGGNITITTDTLVGLQNSDITANSFQGQGGQINITAQGIFGLEVREELTSDNDITAFSFFDPSLNGEVNLQTPDIDPTQGLTDVPTIESPEQVTQVCPERSDNEANQLTTTGRGLPSEPNTPLGDSEILVDPLAPVTETGEVIQPPDHSPNLMQNGRDLLIAQDWYTNNQGQLVLTETAQNSTPQSSLKSPAGCE